MGAPTASAAFFDRLGVSAATVLHLDGRSLDEREHQIFIHAFRLGLITLRQLIETADTQESRDTAFQSLWANLETAEAGWHLEDHFGQEMPVLEQH